MSQTQPTPAPEQKLNLRRLEHIQRLLQYVAGAVLLVFFGLIAGAWVQLRGLNARIAERKAKLEELNKTLDAKEREIAEKQNAIGALQGVNGVLSKVSDAYITEHPEAAERLHQEVEQSIAQAAEAGGGQGGAVQLPARIYIHIVGEGQRKRAGDLAAKLQAKGYLVPGIENVEKKIRSRLANSDLRYFHDDDVARRDVDDIAAVLRTAGVGVSRSKLGGDNVRPRQYEIWLGDDFSPPADSPGRPGPGLIDRATDRTPGDTPVVRPTPATPRPRRTYP